MKKRVLSGLTMLFLAIFLVACSNNDDEIITSGEILGEWTMVSFEYNGSSSFEVSGVNISSEFTGKAKNIDFTMTFIEEPNKALGAGSYDLEVTVSAIGVSDTETTSINDINTSAEWSRDGDILTFNGALYSGAMDMVNTDAGQEYTIEELTDTSLRIHSSVEEITDDFGVETTITMETVMEFTR